MDQREQETINKQAAELQEVLEGFGIPVLELDPNKAQVGPSVIRYRVKLAPGSRIVKFRSNAEDIGREMSLTSVPIIDNIPGEPYIGVDLPRPQRATEFLSNALDRLPETNKLSLNIAAGVTPGGEDIVVSLTKLPHMLVAGSTASGKTVFLHSLLMSLLTKLSSDELEILLVDPKATDFPVYTNVPHLRGGRVITESEDAIKHIRQLTHDELPKRTAILQEAKVPNITEYNEKASVSMKPIVVIIDEYADLVSVLSRKEHLLFEKEIIRLAQRARSVGIHLVLATQRPGTDTLSGLLKANIPCRIAFRLPQRVDSQTALDQSGAENLLGMGDMLFKHERTERLQGYFMSTEEIVARLDALYPPRRKTSKKHKPTEQAKQKTKTKKQEPGIIVRGWRKLVRLTKIVAITTGVTALGLTFTFGYQWYVG